MLSHKIFYDHAHYYEIAFKYRNIPHEVTFLQNLFQHYTGRQINSFLELACGPGYHTIEFAQRNVKSIGLDISSNMIELARERGKAYEKANFIVGDMIQFELQEQVDMAATLLTSIMYILTESDLEKHFLCVSKALRNQGIYFLEANDPRDFLDNRYHGTIWTCEEGSYKVQAAYGLEYPLIDPQTHYFNVNARYEVYDEHGFMQDFVNDSGTVRAWYPEDFIHASQKVSDLQLLTALGDWDWNRPFDSSERSWRYIAIFQKNTEK